MPLDLASADFRFTYARPARLAHQLASSLSFLNFGILWLFLFIGFTVSLKPWGQLNANPSLGMALDTGCAARATVHSASGIHTVM